MEGPVMRGAHRIHRAAATARRGGWTRARGPGCEGKGKDNDHEEIVSKGRLLWFVSQVDTSQTCLKVKNKKGGGRMQSRARETGRSGGSEGAGADAKQLIYLEPLPWTQHQAPSSENPALSTQHPAKSTQD